MNNQPNMSPGAIELGLLAAAAASGDPAWQLQNLNSFKIGLTTLEIILQTATASTLALIRPDTEGTLDPATESAGVSVGLLSVDTSGDDARAATLWAVAPTFAATPIYIKQAILAGVIGQRIEWKWPEDNPLVIPAGGSIVIRNIGAGAAAPLFINARWLGRLPA